MIHNRIRIARTSVDKDLVAIEERLAKGQPFYDTKTNRLFISEEDNKRINTLTSDDCITTNRLETGNYYIKEENSNLKIVKENLTYIEVGNSSKIGTESVPFKYIYSTNFIGDNIGVENNRINNSYINNANINNANIINLKFGKWELKEDNSGNLTFNYIG